MDKIFLGIEVGDIIRVCLDPTLGHEKKKERFCIVIEKGSNHLNLIIVLPITSDKGKCNSHFYIPIPNFKEAGLTKPSVIDCYQIRTIAIERIIKNKLGAVSVGKVNEAVLFDVKQRLAWLLDIGEEHI